MRELMNKKAFKVLSIALIVLIICGGVTGVVYAATSSSKDSSAESTDSLTDTIKDAIKIDKNSDTDGKEETVYAIGDANGNVKKLIVSEWLKNPGRQDSIKDYTELKDIKNTNGNETFKDTGSNTYVWDAKGSDIHYQGYISKELPVKVSVTYLLNGKEIKPEELAGKKGHVLMRFNYTNTQKSSANIDGKNENIYVPFLMASGVILDGDKFSNVKVSTGQVINDGTRDIVIGCAFPGMPESLDVTKDDIDIPETVEIEADTTDFTLDTTLTVGMTGFFDNINIDTDSTVQDLKDSMNDLEDATLDLTDGASDLYSGTSELYDKCQDLESGVGTLLSGSKDLNTGAIKANTGAASLKDGLATLSGNSATLNSGAKQIIDTLFASATTQLRAKLVSSGLMTDAQAANITLTSANYVSVFKQLSGAVTVTPAQVEAQLRATLSAKGMTDAGQQSLTLTIAFDLIKADMKLSYTDAVTQAGAMMSDAGFAQTACAVLMTDPTWTTTYGALIMAVKTATGADDATAAKIAAIAVAKSSTDPASKISEAVTILQHASVVASTTASTDKIKALCTAVADAATSTGNASLDAVKAQLDDVMKFYNGLLTYTGGVDSAYAGSKELAGGLSDLKSGTKTLYDGVTDLYAGSKKLVSGVGELKDGCLELKNGVNEFYDEGIKKLVDSLDGDLTGLFDRLKAVADAGKTYKSFAGKLNDMNGSVRFIYRTDSIEPKNKE